MKIETYRNLIDQIAAAVLILDGEGIIQYANQDTLDLFCFNSEEELLGLSFESLISPDQLKHFQSFYRTILQGKNSHESLYSLIDSEGAFKNTILSGALVQNDTGLTGQTIWTLKDITTLNNYEEDPLQRKKLEDIHWLSEQGRNLLSINRGEEILNFAGRELQRKLNDCLVLTLSNVDESTLQLEGIFGLENKLLNKVWKLIGGDLKGRLFPIEKRYKDSYSRRQLALHPGGLENFSRNHVPPMISKQISKLVGVEDIYTIGLEGNKQVVGCFYIFTKHPNVIPNQGLIESFTFLVALALEKAAFAGKLEYSEQQLRLIFESAPDGYFISDLKGNFLDGNLAAEKITGYDRDELLGKNLLDIGLLTKDQISLAGNQLTSTLFEKKTGPTDTTLISKDGSPKQVEISTHPAKFGNKPVVLGIARDISKQKDSESNLKIAHETLTRVLEGIDAHVYVADMNTHEILYMNKRMIEDFGGDFVGRICYQVFRGENKRCVDCSNPQLVSDRGEPGNVYVWDGQNLKNKRWYRNYDRAIYWADQRLVRMQIAFDITDSIQASNALRRSEERYRNLFESSSNAIMTLSPPNWNFTSGNPAMVEMFGLNDENPFLEYQPWQLSPEFQPDGQLSAEKAGDMIRIAVEKGSNFFNWTHKRINGETFPSTVLLTRVDIEENYYLHATVRDISAQVQAEKQLIQKMDDLAVINTLNVSANQGQSLREILDKLSEETRRIFHCKNTTVYLLSKDESYLSVDIHSLEGSFRGRIEKLININIPDELEVLLREGSAYRKIIFSKQPQILTDPDTIQDLMKDFITSTFLPDPLKKVIRNMIPQIYKLTGIQSMISVPLIASGKLIGLMDMSLPHPFPEEDQERFLTIAEQLSGIIQRVRAEEDRAIKIQELKLINQAIVDGSRIEEIDEICQNLAENIIAVNPKAYVMVSLYDPDQNAIRVRALKGLGKIGDRLSKLLGGKPEDIRIKSADSALDEGLNVLFTSGKLERVPGGLYDLTRGQISRRVCASIERMAGVKDIYIAGFGLRGKSIGGLILFLQGGSQVHYSDAIEAIVSHYAVIFERRIIQQEVLQRKEQLEALRDVELDIVSQLDLKELLYSIAEKATAMVNASAAGFGIYNPDRNVLEYLGYTGFDELPADTDVYPGEGLSGKVWETRKTITVQNYAEWEGKLENWSEMSNYYLAGIPVSWGDEMLGVLEVALPPTQSLSANELSMLELFATQAAIAIKNASLFTEEKMRRIEAETLRELGVLINQMIDHPDLLDMILTSLNKVVPYSSASIQLVQGNDIVVEAYKGSNSQADVIGTAYEIAGNPVAREILYEGKQIILNNQQDIKNLLQAPEIENIASWLAIPLETKGNRVGILTLDHVLPDQYSEKDAALVRDFAAQAVVALENSRLLKEIRRKTSEIEVVYESALALTKELQPEILFKYLYEQIETLFSPDAYILATIDSDEDLIEIAYATEAGQRQPKAEGIKLSLYEKNSLLSWIVRKKTPLLIGNVELDSLPVQPHQEGKTIRSWLGVPLLVGDRICGALVVESYQAQAYSHEHQRLLQLLGNQVAIALENSRLFEDAQSRLSRLSSLREIDQAISGSVDLGLTMDVLLGQLIQTLGVDAACVLSYQPDLQTLVYVNAKGFRTKSLQHTSLKLGEGLAGEAALERHLVYIPNLNIQETSLQKSPLFGKEEFVTYIAQPLVAKGELVGVLEVFHREEIHPNTEWISFLDALARLAAIAIDRLNMFDDLAESNINLKLAYDATIEGWARAIELRDGETEGHSRRVVELTEKLARKMGVSGEVITHIRRGALLHDIGKMAIPDGILLKAGNLSDEEWVIMKKHPSYAVDMLSSIDYLKDALDIPSYHHERWDGSGYPHGLSGLEIPLAARIFSIVDVWDALQSDRPYRGAWPEKQVIEYLRAQSGTQFDPQVVEVFLELMGVS